MSQYQPNAAPGRSFMEKVNSKFSSLSVSSVHHSDKDGSSEDDTLIHKALVNYFDSRGEPFPEWLGVKEKTRSNRNEKVSTSRYSDTRASQPNGSSQFQPVRAAYNSVAPVDNSTPGPSSASHSRNNSVPDSDGEEKGYTRRTNSKLHALYNKSRQQSAAGSSYSISSQPSQNGPSPRSSVSSQRVRDRAMHAPSYGADPSPRPTWGK